MEQKAAHTAAPFTHTPRPALVTDSHPTQRYFRQHNPRQDGPRVTLLRMAGDRRAMFETDMVEWDGYGNINPPHVLEAA